LNTLLNAEHRDMQTLPFMERMVQSTRLRGFGRVATRGETKMNTELQ